MRLSAARLSGGAWHRPSSCSAGARQCSKAWGKQKPEQLGSPARRSAKCSGALLSSFTPHASDDSDREELDAGRGGPSFRHDMGGGTTMGYAKYIGRVGALAVALGVGNLGAPLRG